MPKLKTKFGFTLIELLVVISIIAILMAVATVSYTNAQQKGRDNRRKSDLKAVQQALEIYFNQNGKYPDSSTGRIRCNTGVTAPTTGDNTIISWGSSFACDPDGTTTTLSSITYMNPLPKDPSLDSDANSKYYYDSTTPFSSYKISATLENSNDKDILNLPCTPTNSPTRTYCVINP